MSTPTKITLTSFDGESFLVEEAVAREFAIVSNMIDDDCASGSIPLTNVSSETLGAAIEYCKAHVDARAAGQNEEAPDQLKKWDQEFVGRFNKEMLFSLLLAANYLNCRGLLDLTCQKVADDIKDLQPEDIRKMFSIENDFNEEEEATVRKENEWAFQ